MAANHMKMATASNLGLYNFAAAYGCDAFGSTSYNSSTAGTVCPASATATPTSAPATTVLQNTGVSIILPLIVSISLIGAAVLLFVKRKPHSNL